MEEKEEGGRRQQSSSSSKAGTQGNLLEDSHGPAAAERTAPPLSEYQTHTNKDPASRTPSNLILPPKTIGIYFSFGFSFSISSYSRHPSILPQPPPLPPAHTHTHCRPDSWPVKRRHGSRERRRRQRGDVEEASGRHQEDLRFQRSPRHVSRSAHL